MNYTIYFDIQIPVCKNENILIKYTFCALN